MRINLFNYLTTISYVRKWFAHSQLNFKSKCANYWRTYDTIWSPFSFKRKRSETRVIACFRLWQKIFWCNMCYNTNFMVLTCCVWYSLPLLHRSMCVLCTILFKREAGRLLLIKTFDVTKMTKNVKEEVLSFKLVFNTHLQKKVFV